MPTDLSHRSGFNVAIPVSQLHTLDDARRRTTRYPEPTFIEMDAGFRDLLISATVIVPSEGVLRANRPLIALHGISRDAAEMIRLCAPYAEATRRMVIVPHFDRAAWPVFQRISDKARPDQALLGLIDAVRGRFSLSSVPFDLFGYSAGAQLAHRFAMLYPHLVGDLHLGAAGWYTMPTTDAAYPYGFGASETGKTTWGRRMRRTLSRYLDRRIAVYAGDLDVMQDAALRSNDALDRQQGTDREARARRYVDMLNRKAESMGMVLPAAFVALRGCGHNMTDCAVIGGLLDHVFDCAPMSVRFMSGARG